MSSPDPVTPCCGEVGCVTIHNDSNEWCFLDKRCAEYHGFGLGPTDFSKLPKVWRTCCESGRCLKVSCIPNGETERAWYYAQSRCAVNNGGKIAVFKDGTEWLAEPPDRTPYPIEDSAESVETREEHTESREEPTESCGEPAESCEVHDVIWSIFSDFGRKVHLTVRAFGGRL